MTDNEQVFTVEDFMHWWHPNGAPIFVGNVKDICEEVEKLGFQIYYVIAKEKYFAEVNGKKESQASYATQCFKVVKNLIGRTVVPTGEVALDTFERSVTFDLPKIPYQLVTELDAFFRSVDKKHGTEAIVLLTFDPRLEGSDGWGVIVPTQKNTSGHCDYDVADDPAVMAKPDEVFIVGSVHSHPHMSAFASGVDHNDQADFDGLHITYGWQSSVNNGATQYHVELQMGGAGIRIDPREVFNEVPLPDVDANLIDGWMENVSKKHGGNYVVGGKSSGTSTGSWQGSGSSSVSNGYNQSQEFKRIKAYPPFESAPDIQECVIIGVIVKAADDTQQCPFCDTPLVSMDIERRRCLACHQHVAYANESVADIVKHREEHNIFSYDIDPKNNPRKKIYRWYRDNNADNMEKAFELLYNGESLVTAGG